jgi:HK97 family phage major capsid protein
MFKTILTPAVAGAALGAPRGWFPVPNLRTFQLDHKDAGGGVLPEADFQKKVLDGLAAADTTAKAAQTKADTLVQDFGRLDKETKKAFEDITALKKTANDSASDAQKYLKRLDDIQRLLRLESRAAFGNPIARISSDDEMRTRLNAAVRLAAARSDQNLLRLGQDMVKDLQGRSLTSDSTPGSTYIVEQLAREIYDVLASYGVWNTFGVERLGTSAMRFPVSTARPVAKAVRRLAGRKLAEDAATAGTSVDCLVELWGVFLGVEMELLMDSSYDVTARVLEDFGEAMALKFDELCLTADGTNDENDAEMEGVFETGVAATAANGNTTVEDTDLEDWTNCLLTAGPVIQSRPARWWINPQHIVRALSVKDASGRSIFLNALEAPAAGGIGSILGYPVTPALAAPSTNAAGAKIAVFGEGRGHAFGLRQDFGIATSDDFAFDAAKRMFRGLARAGSKTKKAEAFAVLTLPAN